VGGNVKDVAAAVGLDRRIGQAFLKPGVGFGGSCLSKDTRALVAQGEARGVNVWMFRDVLKVNYEQRMRIVEQLTETLGNLKGKKIAVLGLAFKANTDDLREAPSVTIISQIIKMGGMVKAYDPVVDIANLHGISSVAAASTPYEACQDADAAVLLTEWEEFLNLDLERLQKSMSYPLFIDGRYLFERNKLQEHGFIIPAQPSGEQGQISA
jgi:UDPglucose 6-dehydrogenase